MRSTSPPDRFLNVHEVAEMCGLKVSTIRAGKHETNELLRIKLGGRVVFSLNNVQRWVERRARKAEEDRRRQEWAVANRHAEKEAERRRRKRAVQDTLKTIINGGKYKL